MKSAPQKSAKFLIKNIRNTLNIVAEHCCGYDFSLASPITLSPDDYPYEKTDREILRKAFCELNLPRDAPFLDIGCGKGYVLHNAHQHGFQRVAGIEKNPKLAAIARRNLSRARVPAEVYELDAGEFQGFGDFSVFYMFNPFSENVMQKVIERIVESLNNFPRQIDVLYANPTCHHLLAPHMRAFRVVEGKIAGYNSCIAAYRL